MRELKHHEHKLLKKVDFLQWKRERQHHEARILARFRVQERDAYKDLGAVCGRVTRLRGALRQLEATDPVRVELTEKLLARLYQMGVLRSATGSLADVERLGPAAFFRRRLAVLLVRLRMAQDLQMATTFIEQGHVRVEIGRAHV